MAAKGRRKRTEAARASDGVWPPPPTYETPKPAPQRRLLLPLYMALPQMPKGFGLPKWAETARNYLCCVFLIVSTMHSVPAVSKVIVGFIVLVLLLSLFSWIYRMTTVAVMFVGRKIGRTTEHSASLWQEGIFSATGGGMGLVPNVMFLAWGLSYLDIYHIPRIGLVALIVWGSWFLLGCIVAVVNGAGQWLRERRIVSGTGDESATG